MQIENCRVLVLGGGGFIGSNLCAGLLASGHKVRVLEYPHVRPQSAASLLKQVEWHEGDFTNPVEVDAAIQGCDLVFHLISTTLPRSSNENPAYDVESNLIATLRMLDSARRHGVRKVIYASSGGTVYGVPNEVPIPESHPTQPIVSYGITKLSIEKYLHLFYTLYGLDYCILRLANPYGRGQRVVASQGAIAVFLHKALRDETIEIWGDGSVTRDYIYISDVISAMLRAMGETGGHRLFNIGSGEGMSLNLILQHIQVAIGRDVRRKYLPGRSFDVPINVLDTHRAREVLSWRPETGIEEGIRRTLFWMQESGAI